MRAFPGLVISVVLLPASVGAVQAPDGAISGTVRDGSGAGVPGAKVVIVNEATGLSREAASSDRGDYSALLLPPGQYILAVEAAGFRRAEVAVRVDVGRTSHADVTLVVGGVREAVTVTQAGDSDRGRIQVAGVVSRSLIDGLPLNGRGFLELAKLEPGVTSPVRGTNNRSFLVTLGSGAQTVPRIGHARVTMDGASLATIGGIGTALQVSQEAVDEFQLATASFDVATGVTSSGAVNIATRAGTNSRRGSAFLFYRDDRLAAYPGLVRDPLNPDPFFRRVQAGASVGGPIRVNRAFYFASYERSHQDAVVAVWPSAPEFTSLGGIFPSRQAGNLFTGRLDARLYASHRLMFRHTHDDNYSFAPPGAAALLPSAWPRTTNRVHQSLAGLTSVLSSHVVSDVRLSALSLTTTEASADPDDCTGCFGLASTRVSVLGSGLTFGRDREGRQDGWRTQLTGDLSWTAGQHQLRIGANWEHAWYTTSVVDRDSAQIMLWSPLQVRIRNPALPIPELFTTAEDILRLPLRSFQMPVGSDTGLQAGFGDVRALDVVRLYFGDAWRLAPRWTLAAGLAWTYEPNVLNHDLSKPDLLLPLLGPDRLGPPRPKRAGFSPNVGWTWVVADEGGVVVRGGVGRYTDGLNGANSIHLFNERRYLMPLGTGRFVVSGSNVRFGGRTLDFRQPTTFTGQQLLDALPEIRAGLEAGLRPGNRDFLLRNLDRAKQGSNLFDPDYDVPSSTHATLGVHLKLPFGLVASVDGVYKTFNHVLLNGIDYNRFFSSTGPVIPPCTASQSTDDRAVCSNGPIYFDTTGGRARYRGLLVRLDRRSSAAGTHLVASYALGSYSGTNGSANGTVEPTGGRATGFNNDDPFENDGPLPTDLRHIVNVSGTFTTPGRFSVSFSISGQSRPPFSAYVFGLDFNQDGTSGDLLPGTRVNQFGRGLGKADLSRLVDAYNRDFANRTFNVGGTPVTAPPIILPEHHEFNDSFASVDVRISRSFGADGRSARTVVFVEVFNIFNTANLIGHSGDLTNPGTFGQPSASFSQVFGSGGPRAAQIGARLGF